MFTKAIVRIPGRSFDQGITTSDMGAPDYQAALHQHQEYVRALQDCGLEVTILDPDEDHPDSTFVEDTALITPQCAILTNPGANSRKGEIAGVREILVNYFPNLKTIREPGTLEGGDIMMVGSKYYIGLSDRTNQEGARQLINILEQYGLSGIMIQLEKVLHLKTGVSYLEDGTLLAAGEFLSKAELKKYQIIEVAETESYAANSLWINGTVLVPAGFPQTEERIQYAGYPTKTVDVSEFQKMDGGLSCLSLRF